MKDIQWSRRMPLLRSCLVLCWLLALPLLVTTEKYEPANPTMSPDYIPPFPLTFLDSIHMASSDQHSTEPLRPMIASATVVSSPRPFLQMYDASSTIRERAKNMVPKFDLNDTYFPLGGLFPFTDITTGQVSSSAIQRFEAFRCAINTVNRSPDITGGIQMSYDVYDTQNTPSEALAAAINMIRLNVTSIVGNHAHALYFA